MSIGKETYSIGEKLLASEQNQIAKNANDGGGFRDSYNAGETINGATLPVAVYRASADSEIYACDGDNSTKLNFIGFAISNSTNGNPISVQLEGVVRGFTGLTIGADYYVQNDKTIGTTKGTYPIKVGVAVSTTELLILNQSWQLIGTDTIAASSAVANPSDTSIIPDGTRFIVYDCESYKLETPNYSYQKHAQIFLMPGIITTGYFAPVATGNAAIPTCLIGIKASISGSTLTCETLNSAGGGGATSYIAGTVYYFK